jgi:hypothetical protein
MPLNAKPWEGTAMGARMRSVLSMVVGTMVVVLVGHVAPQPAAAAIGDIIPSSTISLKTASNTDLCPPVNINGIGNNTTGASIAIVQGSKLGPPNLVQYKVLLATSCLGANTDTTRKSTIHFVNPATGVSVHSISTTFVPPRGWSALALRTDKGDLIGCVATGANTGNLDIYKISYTGSAAVLVNSAIAALKGPLCEGLAWDHETKTIYASVDGGTTIRRWVSANNNDLFTQVSPDLISPTQIPLGGGSAQSCLNSGLALVDGALFVACQGLSSGSLSSTGHLVNKSTGAVLSNFGTGTGPLFDQTITADIECDPVTFASQNRDGLWFKNRTTNVLNAFELPAFTCGRSTGPVDASNPPNPLVTLTLARSWKGPGACPTSWLGNPDADTDGDGLLDCWEDGSVWQGGLPGISWFGNSTPDIVLCVNGACADKFRKNIFVEVDSMSLHPVDLTAMAQVIAAFTNAPVPNPTVQSPTSAPGIALHILADDGNAPGSDVIAHANFVALEPCTPAAGIGDANFDQLKKNFFGTKAERNQTEPQKSTTLYAKRMAFRWALLGHDLKPPGTDPGARSSGCAEIGGDDMVVTLGSVYAGTLVPPGPTGVTLPTHVNGNTNDQAGTFMHELGHTLGLRHGGPDNANCKPNYLSVMSYSRQFSDGVPLTARRLDYSRSALATLVETNLSELAGIGVPALPQGVTTDETVFAANGASPGTRVVVHSTIVNNQSFPSPVDWDNSNTIAGSVSNDVNNFGFSGSPVPGCAASSGDLVGGDDWSNLQYNHRATLDVASGASNEVKDPTKVGLFSPLLELFEKKDVNGDGIPDGRCQTTDQPWVIDIQSPIHLSQTPGGDTQVKIFSQPGCIVAFLDPATLTLSGSSGIKGKVKLKNNGTFNCSTPDLNNDGLPDLVCHLDDAGFVLGDVVGVVEAKTSGAQPEFGLVARAGVIVTQ